MKTKTRTENHIGEEKDMYDRTQRWPGTDPAMDVFMGVDLGQSKDYTAIVVMEGLQFCDHYRVTHLERMRGVSYPKIVQRIEDLVQSDAIFGENVHLLVDKTGVGAHVVDLMFEKNLNPIGITITGGDKPVRTYLNEWKTRQAWAVPKRDLLHNLLLMAQSGMFKIVDGLPDARILMDEMMTV